MATIYNYCDLLLQATSPRLTVTAVTIVPNNSGFLKPKNTLSLTPGSILLSTTLEGFTAPVYSWYYAVPTAPTTFIFLVSGTSATGHNQYPVSNTTFLTHVGSGTSVIYKCKVSQVGWKDAESTTTLTYTKQNNDIPVATLNKTSIVLPTTAADEVDYSNSGSRITVSIGGSNIAYGTGSNTFSIDTPTITSGTIVVDPIPETQTTINLNDTRVYDDLSGMAAGPAPATITYTVKARDIDGVETTIPLTQTISKALSGSSGYVYKLIVPSIVIREQDNINFNPTTITASATRAIGQAAASPYSGIFKIYTSTNGGATYTLRNTSAAVSSYDYILQDYASVPTSDIKVELYLIDGITLIDTEIIAVNREGQYSLNLTNDNHTVSTDSSGTATGLSITSEAEIYLGLTKQTTGWTFAWTASAGITITGAATNIVTVTGVTADGTVTVVATQTGSNPVKTRTAVFTISRAIAASSIYTATIYRQIASTTAPSGGSYNFSNGTLSAPTDWSTTQFPVSTTPTWACSYTFIGTPTSTVAGPVSPATWTNLHINAVKGDPGANSVSSATIDLYILGNQALPTGSNFIYNFTTGVLTTGAGTSLNGWNREMPAVTTTGVYKTSQTFTATTASSGNTTVTAAAAWSTARLVAQSGTNGAPGDPGDPGAPGSATFVINRGAAATNTAPTAAEIIAASIGRASGNGIAGDIVTIYNNTNNNAIWRCSVSGTPGTWVTQASYLTGDLIVAGTITADKLKSSSTISTGLTFALGGTLYGYNPAVSATTSLSNSYALQGISTFAATSATAGGGGGLYAASYGQYTAAAMFHNSDNLNFNNLNTLIAVGDKNTAIVARKLYAAGTDNNGNQNNFISQADLGHATFAGKFEKYNATTSGAATFVIAKKALLATANWAVEAEVGSIKSSSYNFSDITSIYYTAAPSVVIAVNSSVTFEATQGINYSYKGISPSADNAAGLTLGTSDARWKEVFSANGVTTTSDVRLKTNIQNSNLGLEFINQLRPVSYKFISGGKTETGEFIETIVPGTDNIHKEPIYEDVAGVRTHYGLIAQEVKTTLNTLNTGDFAGFVLGDKNDPDSRHHLRYDQFIAPLIKAVQELSAKVTALENQLNS